MLLCSPRYFFALAPMALVAALVASPACAQQTSTSPAASQADDAPTPPATTAADMTIAQIADVAARGILASGMITEKYTYVETEHNQNFIDGTLQVDHTTVTENIFIHGLPYMRKIAVDGKPLEGKDLKKETALYEQAVKTRTALDEAARANILRHALRTTSRTDLDKLATTFQLALGDHELVDGHDCIVLIASPLPENATTALARQIRMDIDPTSLNVIDLRIEFLADDNGFSKGSVLDTHYSVLNGVPLATHQTWDTTVQFKELLNKKIRIHRDITYTNYRRFHATATIHSFVETADSPSNATPIAGPTPATPDAPKTKSQLKAEHKAAAEANAKAKAEFKEQEKLKAAEDAKTKAKSQTYATPNTTTASK